MEKNRRICNKCQRKTATPRKSKETTRLGCPNCYACIQHQLPLVEHFNETELPIGRFNVITRHRLLANGFDEIPSLRRIETTRQGVRIGSQLNVTPVEVLHKRCTNWS
ncbi:MAG: hypothetical protein GY820_34405 [Gammaproteobacteria bacterium]|nr:hypothetical protein [Gammaproteobacteria bacterium]